MQIRNRPPDVYPLVGMTATLTYLEAGCANVGVGRAC